MSEFNSEVPQTPPLPKTPHDLETIMLSTKLGERHRETSFMVRVYVFFVFLGLALNATPYSQIGNGITICAILTILAHTAYQHRISKKETTAWADQERQLREAFWSAPDDVRKG